MKESDGKLHQVMLDVVVPRQSKFVFNVQISSTKCGSMMIGVVDRYTQAQQHSSFNSGNVVCYYGFGGSIWYGKDGNYVQKKTGIKLQAWTEVEVEVELDKGTATFTICKRTSNHRFQQSSGILTQPNRQFVPYFQMVHVGDSIRWAVK